MLPKIGSVNGDATGSQQGSGAVSCETDLTFKRLFFARAIDVLALALPCCIGKDVIKIDPGRGCRCGRKRLKRNARRPLATLDLAQTAVLVLAPLVRHSLEERCIDDPSSLSTYMA
jgi:hypothetical protein